MIDYEKVIFDLCAAKLREHYGAENIYIVGAELTDIPPRFPAVSIIQIDNKVEPRRGGTLTKYENVAISTLEVQAYSNLVDSGEEQVKEIISIVDSVFADCGYYRIMSRPLLNMADRTISRRVGQWRNDTLTENFLEMIGVIANG
jgi:hypothetical protein